MGLDHRTYNAASKELVINTKHLDVLGSIGSKESTMERYTVARIIWQHECEGSQGIITKFPAILLRKLRIEGRPPNAAETGYDVFFDFACEGRSPAYNPELLEKSLDKLCQMGILEPHCSRGGGGINNYDTNKDYRYPMSLHQRKSFCDHALDTGAFIHEHLGIIGLTPLNRFDLLSVDWVKYNYTWMTYVDYRKKLNEEHYKTDKV